MNERIRFVRDDLDLTRAAFGKRIGVSGDVINNLERGRVEIKEHIIKLICSEYNVNETWLRTGEGDMFIEMPEEDLYSRAAGSLLKDDDALAIEGLKLYYSLRPEEKEAAANYILRLADMIREHQTKQVENIPAVGYSIKEAEAEYIKSRSENVQKKDSSVLNTTAETKTNYQSIG